MHIPDGFLTNRLAFALNAVSIANILYVARRLQHAASTRIIPMMGILSAFVFAAQMLNFPVAGGTSGHLIGAALAAILLGPWAAMLVLTSVLAVQALLYVTLTAYVTPAFSLVADLGCSAEERLDLATWTMKRAQREGVTDIEGLLGRVPRFNPFLDLNSFARFATAVAGLGFLVSLPLWFWFDRGAAGFQFVERADWIPSIGVQYFFGVDGISALLRSGVSISKIEEHIPFVGALLKKEQDPALSRNYETEFEPD